MTAALLVARDSRAWDRYIAGASDGSILQSWGWGELKRHYGWQPSRYFWERDGIVQGGISVLRRPIAGGFALDYAPHGPVLDGNLREWPAFWSALREELAVGRGTILRIEPQWKTDDTWIIQETGARSTEPIQQQAIRDGQSSGCTIYDLWGIPVDAKPGDAGCGYAHFKTMLGGVPLEFGGAWDLPIRRPLAVAYHFAERMLVHSRAAA